MKKEIETLLSILEHPDIKKGYKEFKIYLELNNRTEEADAFEYLLKKKFTDVIDNSNIN